MEVNTNVNLYKEVLRTMSACVLIQGKSGQIIPLNENVETVLGITSEFLTESSMMQLEYVKEDESRLNFSELPGSITLEQGITFKNYILGVNIPNHDTKWLSINSKPINIHENGEKAALITISDITERKKWNRQLFKRKKRQKKQIWPSRIFFRK